MRLPVYEISGDGYGNKNPEGPVLEMTGRVEVEQTTESLLSPYPTFKINAPMAYLTEVEATDDWTAEFVIDTVKGSILLSTSEYGSDTGFTISYYGSIMGLSYRYNGYNAGYRNVRLFTNEEVPTKNFVIAIVKVGDTLKYYIDSVLRGQIELVANRVKGTINLMGHVTSSGSVVGSTGKFYEISISPGVELPESMMSKVPNARGKSLDNSFFIDEKYGPLDLTAPVVAEFESFENSILIINPEGDIERFSRPRGQDVGNSVESTGVNEQSEFVFNMSGDVTLNAGTVPEIKDSVVGTPVTLDGSYYSNGALLPIVTEGNGLSLKDGKVSLASNGNQSPDYSTYVRLEARFKTGDLWFGKTEWGAIEDSFPIPYVVYESENKIGKRTSKGFKFKAGKYYVRGFISPPVYNQGSFQLTDGSGNILYDTGYLTTSHSNASYVESRSIDTVVTLYEDTEILLIENSGSYVATDEEALRIKLEIFKVL